MPSYDYKCPTHGVFTRVKKLVEHTRVDECPTCGLESKQVILSAPPLDMEAMADCGFPGAEETVGDRITKRHQNAGQYHTDPSIGAQYWRNN